VRFDDPHHGIDAFIAPLPRGLQHRKGLPHACRSAKENLQPAALLFLFVPLDLAEKFIGIGTVHPVSPKSGRGWRQTRRTCPPPCTHRQRHG
jgi:hypothetical protein